MATDDRISLLARVARTPSPESLEAGGRDSKAPELSGSILMLAGASWGAKPDADSTVPTGFDPGAVLLFEAILEAAYVVASADGVFDEDEKRSFERVITAACGGTVAPKHIAELVADLETRLKTDGLEKRIHAIGENVVRKNHAREVLRIAVLLAQASEDVSDVERGVLLQICEACGLPPASLNATLAEVRAALRWGAATAAG